METPLNRLLVLECACRYVCNWIRVQLNSPSLGDKLNSPPLGDKLNSPAPVINGVNARGSLLTWPFWKVNISHD